MKEVTIPLLSVIIASSNPTSCRVSDGEITISDLSNNANYAITYEIDSFVTTLTITSNNLGEVSIENLTSGNYTNISIEEVSSGCLFQIGLVSLNCEIDNNVCFETTAFFTPNGDGINDFWFLNPLSQNNICRYKLLIFSRYGKLIKTLTNTNSHWDGSYNGNKLPSSDYWFVVYYNDGEQDLIYKSHFALKR